jgi:hypothetical protein
MKRLCAFAWFGGAALAAALCASCAPVDTTPPKGADGGKAGKPFVAPKGLQQRIDLAVKQVRRRELRADHGFWTVFHAILGLGPKTVELTTPEGKRVNAIDYIAGGGQVDGMIFRPTRFGVDVINAGAGPDGVMFLSQGHQDQFIAEMIQWGLPKETKFRVEGKDYTFADFINHCKMRVRVKKRAREKDFRPQELSWAIVVLASHLDKGTRDSWVNGHGEKLHFEDLMEEEVQAEVENAACGGTHRLFGLTWAYHLHLKGGGKTEGVWKAVAEKLEVYKAKAKALRNRRDGSFSTNFFVGEQDLPDTGKRINTTGHTLEWLALAMTEDELRAPWVEDAANALTKMIFDTWEKDMDGASLYHAVHGLLIYYDRLYDGGKLGTMRPVVPLPSDGPPWRKR